MTEEIKIITTSDGSHTIYVPELNEHYHSVHGAVLESSMVFIENGFRYCRSENVSVFEAGFGTGLNALLTLTECIRDHRSVNYTAIEKYPLSQKITDEINHWAYAGAEYRELFNAIHSSQWNTPVRITDGFTLTKLQGDLITDGITGLYDIVYFDAFAPSKQPEIWSDQVIRKMAGITNNNGIFVTYSCKGDLKRLLRKYGFTVKLLPGPPGKREVLRAIKT